MSIRDKIEVSKIRRCPPHYLPHKFPLNNKICDEKCHIHKAGWRMLYHKIFYKFLNCPNYDFMIKKNEEFLRKNKFKNLF